MAKNRQVLIKFEGDSRGLVNASRLSQKELGEIQRSAKQASGELTGMSGKLGAVAKNVALLGAAAATAAAAGLAYQVKQTIDLADNYAKLSQKVNVSVESLSTLDYVANLNGTSLNVVSKALLRVSSNLLDADRGLKESVENFQDLGIETKTATGQLRSADDVLIDVADRFAQMEDGTQKTALAMKLFGKSGAELIPMLNMGSAGIRELQEEARKLGLEIGTETAKQAEIFNDNIYRMQQLMKGVAVELTTSLLPKLEELTSLFLDKRLSGGSLFESLSFALSGRDAATNEIKRQIADQQQIQDDLLEESSRPRLLRINPFRSDESIKAEFDERRQQIKDLEAELERLYSIGSEENKTIKLPSVVGSVDASAVEASTKAREQQEKATTKARESLESMNLALIQQAETFGKSETDIIKYRLSVGDLSDEVKLAGDAGKALADSILLNTSALEQQQQIQQQAIATQAQDAADKLRATDIVKGLRTEEEQLAQAINEVKLLVEGGYLTDESGSKEVDRLIGQFDDLKNKAKQNKDQFDELRNAVNGWGRDFANSVVDADFTFAGFVDNVLKQLAKIALQQATQPFFNAFGDLLSAGAGSLFSGFGGAATGSAANVAQNGISFSADGNMFNRPSLTTIAERGQPEAVLPLARVGGQLGVQVVGGSSGSSGQPIQISIAVDANGSAVSGNEPKGNQLGKALGNAVRDVLVQEKRPGGLLS